MKKTKLLAIMAAVLIFAGCSNSAPETGSEITTADTTAVTETVTAEDETSEDITEELSEEDMQTAYELKDGIEDNKIYVYPSSDQLTPTAVNITDDEAAEITGFINAAEKTVGEYETDANIYFKSGKNSVNIASYNSAVMITGAQSVSCELKPEETERLIEIVKTESGIDLSAYLD